jgi:RHS repeat-associated protein
MVRRLSGWVSWVSWVLVVALLAVGLPAASAAAASRSSPGHPTGSRQWKGTPAPQPKPFGWSSPKGKNTPLVKPDPHAKRVKELPDRRSATASYFQMSDGSVQEELSAVPVHYRDAKGQWQNVDTSVKPVSHAGFTSGVTGNAFQTYFGSGTGSLMRMESGSGSIQLDADGANLTAPKISGGTVTYPGVFPGADVSYQTGPDGVKESIVLAKAPAAGATYAFTMKVAGLTPKQLPDGAIAFYGSESADAAFVIPAPVMSDAKPDPSSPYGVAYSANVTQSMTFDAATGLLHLTVTPDASWLASSKRVYPVTVDPTIVVSSTSSTAANVMILADGPTTNYSTSWRLSVGTTATGAARTLIKFAMPSVPSGTTITSADLQLYYDQTFLTGGNAVSMQALAANAAWSPATATWSNASSIGGPVAGTTATVANQLGVWNDFPVTSTVQGWLSGTTANNGFVLKAASESTLSQGGPRYEGSGYYYNGEVKNYPKLVITYGVPGVTVNPPTVIHSTGAELSWPAYTNTTGNTANDIAEYQVHRSINETFTPTADTEISPVLTNQTSFVDSTAVPTPANNSDPYGNAYYYMVVVKTKSGALIPGPTTVVRLPEAGRTTLLIPAQSATTLSSTLPTTVLNTLSNAGTPQPWLEVGDDSGTYGVTHSVLNFPALTAVPSGSTILDAHLKLWQETTTTGTSGAVYELHPLTKPFTGTQATWNSAATGTAWTTPGGDFGAVDGTLNGFTNDPNRRNFDATSIVQGWVNTPASDDGLLLKLAAELSTSPREHTVFAGPATAEPALAPTLVVTYLDTSTGSTYYAPSTPNGMVPGTTYSVPVTINNTTAATWPAASEVLTYHWTLPDGTDVTTTGTGGDQLRTALPADLAPAGTVTLNAQVTPPAVTDGNQDEGATLAWDMYNTATGTYLSGATTAAAPAARHAAGAVAAAAGGGTGSLKQQISVDPTGNNQLGLEKFYPYTTTATGSGSNLYSNTASGNTVWNDDLFSNPSVGFDTTLRLSYNSMSTMDTTTGFGWSIEASAPIRLGQALQFHPATTPTSMVMVDGTGNAHQWALTTDASGNVTGTPPAGVHLFLQGKACKPQDSNARAWKMTRPDRTTYYFDCEGYPTAQIDPNGNEADFSYSDRQSQNAPEEFLDHITDPMGRNTLQFTYYNKGDSYSYVDSTGALVAATGLTDPAIIDHVRSITDVSGRTVDFYYTSQGQLGQLVDGAGTGTGNNAPKTFKFTYDATQGMKNVKLTAVQDPRGDTTGIAYYPTSSPTKWWTQTVTDRLQHATGFAYTQPGTGGVTTETTVTDVHGGTWVYDTNSAGLLTKQTDPAIQATPAGATAPTTVTPVTTIGWDGDNNVTDLKENNGAETKWTYDGGTGLPVDVWDPQAVKNGTASTHYTLATTDNADTTLSGRVGFVDDITTPLGYRTQYNYYGLSSGDPNYVSTPGYAGNLSTVQAPDGTAQGAPANSYLTTYTYDTVGDVATVKDPDGNTTTYGYTKYIGPGTEQAYEPTGQPLTVTDAMTPAGIYTYVYDAVGEVTSMTDPLSHTSSANYDVFGRLLDSQVPKDQASGSYVITPSPVYDGNDNVLQKSIPYLTGYPVANSTTTTVYDKNDAPLTVTLPANTTTTSPAPAARTVTYGYDYANHKTTVTEPLGNVAGASAATTADYTTTTNYNAVNQVTETDHLAPDGTTTLKTQYGYDDVGNKITVTDPLGNKSTTTYDLDHRVSGTLDAIGSTTGYGYDLDGRQTSATDQNGHQTTFGIDPDNKVTEVDVPRAVNTGTTPPTVTAWNITKYSYDQAGNNTAVISPKGVAAGSTGPGGAFTASAHYDADNRVDKAYGAFDPNDPLYKSDQQPETDYHRDVAGRVTSVDLLRKANTFIASSPTSAETATTSYTYWDNGWTHTSTDPFTIKTSYDYNGTGQQNDRLLTASDGSEATTDPSVGSGATRDMHWLYNPDGSLWQSSDTGLPNGFQDQVLPANSGWTWAAGPAGQGYDGATYYTGSGNFQWNMAVPATGDYKVYVWHSTSGTSNAQYSYYDSSNANHSLGTVDQTKNVGSWQVLNGGTPVNLVAGSKQVLQLLSGDANGVADAIKIVCTDCAGAGTGTTQTHAFTYSYDANGNLSDLADGSPSPQIDDYTPTFDDLDRLTQLVEKKSGAAVHTLKYGYDAAGNLSTQSQDTAATGAISAGSFDYTALNQLKQATDTQNGVSALVTNYTYYPNGQPHTEQKGNNNLVTDTYNPDNTLAGTAEATSTGTVVDQHTLGYDPNNNLSSDAATLQKAGGGTLTQNSTLAYSPNNQVVSVTNGQDDQKYVYDSAGNVEQEQLRDSTSGSTGTTDFVYNRDRLYTANPDGTTVGGTYQYDTVGRLGEIVGGVWQSVGTVNQQYQYDGFDNITSESSAAASGGGQDTTTSVYDSLNRAVSQTITGGGSSQDEKIDYLGISGTIADEQVGPSGAAATESKVYDYSANGERLALLDGTPTSPGSNETDYYSYSPHGDVEALTDGTGATNGTYGYTAYGVDDKSLDSGHDDPAKEGTFPFNAFRFNAARVSSTTGTLNMGARTYDPSINRFVSRDSYNAAGADAGLSGASRYAFAGGNPISNIEADGHSFWSVVGGIAAGAAVIGGCAIGGVLTGGVAAFACVVGAGLVGAVAAQGISCGQQGGGACSPGAFGTAAAEGVVGGAVAFGVAAVLPEALAGWATGAAVGAASGAAGYGTGCALGAACSWTGLAVATAGGAALGGVFGAAGSALKSTSPEDAALAKAIKEGRVTESAPLNHRNGAMAEELGWREATGRGEISVAAPGKITAVGPDYITYDPDADVINVWDAKFSKNGRYPSSLSQAKMDAWEGDVEAAVKGYSGPHAADILNAWSNGQIVGKIFGYNGAETGWSADK